MRVHLRGIHFVRSKLADGSFKTYHYAWRGGPALNGQPGTPEFIASYNRAVERAAPVAEGKLQTLIDGYQKTQDFLSLRPRTKADYIRQIKIIEAEFGDLPIKALAASRTRGVFKEWRDGLAVKSLRQADYAWTVLAKILAVAKDYGKVSVNPCEKGGRLYNGTRVDFVWSVDDEAAFLSAAPKHLHLPLLLALWTGQRQGDLLRLTWGAYDGEVIKFRQSKTSARVLIPVGAPLKEALDAAAPTKKSPVILLNSEGRPWTSDGFRASWRKAADKAGIQNLTFNDLRGTAVTRLAMVGCTEPQIAAITGHSTQDVRSILDQHYLHRDQKLAFDAIHKLELAYAKSGTGT